MRVYVIARAVLRAGWSDRRVEEPGAQREEELLQAADRAGHLRQPSQEAAGGQVEEEELHPFDKRVTQLSEQAAGEHQQPRLHDSTRLVQQQPTGGAG